MATPQSIVNYALEMIASQAQITALNDGTVEGDAAGVIYQPTLQLLMREMDPDFARTTAALTAAATTSPLPPFAYEYVYPADCLRARQVAPPPAGTTGALADPFDPLPIPSEVAYDPNGGGASMPAKVILTNQQNAWLSYTTSNANEADMDAAFIEAFARRLGSPLAMAIAGRPDFANAILEQSERYAGLAELVDENSDGRA
jgi:hypothetical protein